MFLVSAWRGECSFFFSARISLSVRVRSTGWISGQAVVRHLVESAHEHSFFLQEYPWFAFNCCNSAAPLWIVYTIR